MLSAATLATLHQSCFQTPRPWSADEFDALLASRGCFLIESARDGFLLGRVVADEAELLTLAVSPDARRQGIGATLLAQFEQMAASRGARDGFLEVSAQNAPAYALYVRAGWQVTGTRSNYYQAPDGARIDARIMGKVFDAS